MCSPGAAPDTAVGAGEAVIKYTAHTPHYLSFFHFSIMVHIQHDSVLVSDVQHHGKKHHAL